MRAGSVARLVGVGPECAPQQLNFRRIDVVEAQHRRDGAQPRPAFWNQQCVEGSVGGKLLHHLGKLDGIGLVVFDLGLFCVVTRGGGAQCVGHGMSIRRVGQ